MNITSKTEWLKSWFGSKPSSEDVVNAEGVDGDGTEMETDTVDEHPKGGTKYLKYLIT